MATECAVKNSKIMAGVKRLIYKCYADALEAEINKCDHKLATTLREIAEKLEGIIS